LDIEVGQQMKILVTGGLGLIGHNVVQRLEALEHEVIITDTRTNYGIIPQAELDYLMSERLKKISGNNIYHIDITDADNFDWLVNKHKPEVIIHMASFPRQKVVNANPAWGSRVMMEGLINVCESAKKHGLDVEDRVVAKFMLGAMRGGVLKVNGAGETLDFTYVDDAADGIVAAATRIMSRNNTYNITKSHSVSLLEAAEMIVKIVGKGTIECKDKDADFPSRGALNIDRARTILGYDPKIDVEEGFQNYFNWLNNSVYWSKKAV